MRLNIVTFPVLASEASRAANKSCNATLEKLEADAERISNIEKVRMLVRT